MKERERKKKVPFGKRMTAVLFGGVILVLLLLTLFLPKKEMSEEENKKLAVFPDITVKRIFNGSFMSDLDTYLSDHFAFRTGWIRTNTNIQKAMGKVEINDVFITGNRMLEDIGQPNEKYVSDAIDAINSYAADYGGNMHVSMMLVPTASEIYRDSLPKNAPLLDQAAFIQDVYSRLDGVGTVDVFTSLNAAQDAYIYYRTDHHWTSYGAYIGYSALSKELSYNAIGYDLFNIEHASDAFLGTLYSKVLTNAEMADTIDLYHYADKNVVVEVEVFDGEKTQTYPSIFFKDYLNTKDKYSTYLGTNVPMVKIHTTVANGQKLLMFKDSYSHELVQFLCQHYEEITLLDLRYFNMSFTGLVDPTDYTQTLFVYNMGGFITDGNIRKLNLR